MDIVKAIRSLKEGYEMLRGIEIGAYADQKEMNTLINGRSALAEARAIQEQFFPKNEESEKIVMMLLNDRFKYDGKDYSSELTEPELTEYAQVGLLLYMSNILSSEAEKLNDIIIAEFVSSFC